MKRQSKFVRLPVLGVGLSGLIGAIATQANALQLRVTPTNPKLGDTLSVVVQPENTTAGQPPVVTLNNQVFQTFDLGNNRFRALLPTTPLDSPGTLKLDVAAGGEAQTLSVNLKNRQFPLQSIWLPPGKNRDISDAEFERVTAFKQLVTPQKFWNGKFLRPSQGRVSGAYGIRRKYNGVLAKDYYHRGVDYAGGYGSPVIAPAAGVVRLIGLERNGFLINGNIIGIDHGQGVTSAYLHLSRILVKEGQMVKPGQVIGAIGSTGSATGPHLHWGLYVNGSAVDPVPWREGGFE